MQVNSAEEQGLDREALVTAWRRVAADRRDRGRQAPTADVVEPLIGWLTSQRDLRAESPTFQPMVEKLVHARLEEGGDLSDLVAEYGLLGECAAGLWATERTLALHRWLARAIAIAVTVYTDARDCSLAAIELVSKASIHSVGVEELLQRLVYAFEQVTPRVDAAAIALCEGDHVRVHAGCGAAEKMEGSAQRVGEGFMGRIVVERRPLVVHPLDGDPLFPLPGMRQSHLRTLYGVPMIEGGEVLGVALMGSCTAFDFSRDDHIVFEVMVRHATSAIRYRNTRESLEREKARIEALLGAMPAGVIVVEAPSGKVILHNHHAETIWRRRLPSSIVACDSDAWAAYHRDGRAVEPEEWGLSRAIRKGETVFNQEVDILRGDGSRATILNCAAPIRADGARIVGGVATFTDITEKRKTEERLQQALAHAQRTETMERILAEAGQKLAESLDKESVLGTIAAVAVPRVADYCGIFVADEHRRFVVRDFAIDDPDKARRVRDQRPHVSECIAGSPFLREVFDTGAMKLFAPLTEESLGALAGGCDDLQDLLRELGMTTAVFVPMIARGRTLGVVAFACISKGREFSSEDVALAEALTRCSAIAVDNHTLYQSAHEAARQREDILAIVSHDLRSALSAVELNAELLSAQVLPGPGRGPVDRILKAARRMGRFIRDLVDSAAIAAGTLDIEKKLADVPTLVETTIGLFYETARQRGVTLAVEVGENLPPLRCDATRVGQTLENLVSNALKVSETGGLVHVRAHESGEEILFSVTDTGPGMPTQTLGRLFERYYRGQNPKGQGLGLGLTIAKAIVSGHGGRIWVESTVGKGSVFSFSIPLRSAEDTGSRHLSGW